MKKLDQEVFNHFVSYLTNSPNTEEDIDDFIANAINLAPVMANEILLLREVVLAGNGLVQWGVSHATGCASRTDRGYCDCGQEEIVNEFIHAWDRWQG